MEFLTVNGINVEPTEENIVNAVKMSLEDYTSKEAQSLKERIKNAEVSVELPNSFFMEDNDQNLCFINMSKDSFLINIDLKNGGQVVYLREFDK
jgi:hypothetical protein